MKANTNFIEYILSLLLIAFIGCATQKLPEPVSLEVVPQIQEDEKKSEIEVSLPQVEEYARIHQISDLKKAEFYLKNPDYARENPYKPTDEDIEFYERPFLEKTYPEFKELAQRVGFMKARKMYMDNPPFGPGSRRIGTTRYDDLFQKLNARGADSTMPLIFERDPAGASYQEGMRLYREGKIDEAIAEMEKSIRIKPDSPGVLYNLGVMYTQKENYAKAVEVLQNAVKSVEETGFTRLNLAMYSDAYMGSLTNLGLIYIRIGMYNDAIKVLKKAVQFKPKDIDANCDLVNAYYMMGDMEKASEQMRKCLEIDPKNAELHNFSGLMYYRKELYNAALDAFKTAVSLNPEERQYSYNLGLVLDRLGRQDEAKEAFQKASGFKDGEEMRQTYIAKTRSNQVKQLYNDGHKAMDELKWSQAIELFKRAIELDPNMTEAHFNLGVSYGMIGDKKNQIFHLEKAVNLKPDEADFHYNLGVAYTNSYMYTQAIAAFKRIIELKPSYKDAHFQLGMVFYKLENYTSAAEEFEKSLKLDPNWYEAYINLGTCYMKLKDPKTAINIFMEAVRLRPNSAEARYNLGAAYMNSGNYEEAYSLLQKSLELDPGYRPARIVLKDLESYLGK